MKRMISFEPPTRTALLCVTRRLRERDRAECLCQSFTTPEELADGTLAAGGLQWVVWLGDLPVASIGAACAAPGLWTAWAYATDEWPAVVGAAHRWALRVIRPALEAAGARRMECLSLRGHHDAHHWLLRLGANPEGVLRQRGRGGEDFVMFAWVRGAQQEEQQTERPDVYPATQH